MSSFLNSFYSGFGGAVLAGNEKKNKITVLVLSGIFLFFLLAGSMLTVTPALAEPIALEGLEVSATHEPTAEQRANHKLGAPDVQAGSHPYALVTTFFLNGPEAHGGSEGLTPTGGGLKNVRFELPPGFVGNPNATAKCSYDAFESSTGCPSDTAVGVATTIFSSAAFLGGRYPGIVVSVPVYNIEPPGGVAADFGFIVNGVTVFLDASVRTGGDYGITVNTNIPQIKAIIGSRVTIWGVPAAAVHDPLRGRCLNKGENLFFPEENETPEQALRLHNEEKSEGCSAAGGEPVQPLLTNPTSCGTPRAARLSVESWGEPAESPSKAAELPSQSEMTAVMPELSGCEKLDFSPTLGVTPDGTVGSTPTGLNVGVHVSQESTTNPEGLGEADVKDTTVALPPGVQVSPSASDGLQACSDAEIGFTGEFRELDPVSEPGVKTPQFTPYLPGSVAATQAGDEEPLRPGVNFCPDASKIANVKIKTPLLEGPLTGAVYLAAPQNFRGLPENPFESLIAMYLVAEEPTTGVLVKLPGKVSLNEATGQITTTFVNTPQTPFSDLELEFFGTARAPLATPAYCGTYNTESSFEPWSGEPAAHPPASFQITSGPNGSSCTYPGQALPFSPSLSSDTTNNQAGAFTPLSTTLGREDGQQQIQQVTLHYPPGVTGLLSGVKLCEEAQANAGTCGPESEIGESIVSVGLGNDPFTVVGGKAYITGPYEGAPFGLSIVNPTKAGPFVLQEGRPVVVRAKIEVDPHTAALTVTTNTPAEGYAIPSMIEGIPLQIKHVNVLINRPGFTINPTDCNAMQVTGTVASNEGVSSPVSIPFQVTNCGDLKFAPDFKVSTSGKTSKAQGASLTTTVTYPSAAQGTYADIARVKVELPKQLPSRLTTLQKACTNAQFEANPAACPAASKIGYAIVHTPLLPVPLMGPAIFVSHGGEAFPSLTMVLQGDNVTVDLVGTTYISPAGITSTTFKTLPDSPFSSFELTLPEGPYSALAANGNLCAPTTSKTVKKKVTVKVKGRKKTATRKVTETKPATLVMPNEFVAQNGTVIKQTTTISVTGCPPARAKTVKAKAKKQKKKKGKR